MAKNLCPAIVFWKGRNCCRSVSLEIHFFISDIRRKQLVDNIKFVDRILKRMSIASTTAAATEEEQEEAGNNPPPPPMVSILSASDLEQLEALAGDSDNEEESTAYDPIHDEEQVVPEMMLPHKSVPIIRCSTSTPYNRGSTFMS